MKTIPVLLFYAMTVAVNTSPLLFKDLGPSCQAGTCGNFCIKQWPEWPDGYGISADCSVAPIG